MWLARAQEEEFRISGGREALRRAIESYRMLSSNSGDAGVEARRRPRAALIALIDTSVVLRKLFGEPDPLAEWSRVREAFASRILVVELGGVIHRARMTGDIDDQQVEQLQREARHLLRSVEVLALSERILARAEGPMPTVLGTLDAIHLATAQEIAATQSALVVATHDAQLARAARASGLEVCGA